MCASCSRSVSSSPPHARAVRGRLAARSIPAARRAAHTAEDLKASTVVEEKKKPDEKDKKKKRGRKTLKITNKHMLSHGVDFTQDYIPQG